MAVLSAAALASLCGTSPEAIAALAPSWADLAPDLHLKDGGSYRKRRHSCFELLGGAARQTPHRPHWQPLEYNALHGGIERWFEPMAGATVAAPAWAQLLQGFVQLARAVRPGVERWFVEAHQFRIDTANGIGRPTPEGAHRDGVDLVVVALVGRSGVKGGETRVFEAASPSGQRFTLAEPWTALVLDDARMIHETTPIQPQDAGGHGVRDTLVLTYRSGGFQGPA